MPADRHLVVVTGGAQGIGRAIVLAVARRQGDDIVAVDMANVPVEVVEAAATAGASVHVLRADVSREDEVKRVADQVADLGSVRALVNSAAIFPRASALEMPFSDWMHVVATNLGGTFLMSRVLAPLMMAAGGGAIVNLASGRAVGGAVRGSHYSASKGGVISLTRSLALEWAPTIRVNAVMPGVTDTAQPRVSGISDEELYAMGSRIPLGRIGRPDDVAGVVTFLLSDDAAYITGQTIAVNGGSIML